MTTDPFYIVGKHEGFYSEHVSGMLNIWAVYLRLMSGKVRFKVSEDGMHLSLQ